MSAVDIRLLGPLEVEVDARRVEVRRQKQRALLALLALRAGEVVSIDRLVDELWGETPPKAAVGSLQNLVSDLRKSLGAALLVTRAPGYVLAVERQAVDAHRFERLVREARDASPADRASLLRDALALWRGPALADVRLDESAAEGARLEELRLAAWEDRIEAELELGGHAQAIGELESLVATHPLRERPVRLLMLALYRAGRQVDALEAYRRARETLVEELGIDPSPELQRLERAILRQDAELDLAPAPKQRSLPRGPDRRKTVTVVFVDLVASTELAAMLDPEVLRGVMARYFDVVRSAVERNGGVVEKFIGDAVMAAFGVPTLREDDALRAVRAAVEVRDSLRRLNEELAEEHGVALQIRVGVNTGEVLAGDPSSGEAFVTGQPVNHAMRLEQAALPGEILLGQTTYGLVRHAVDAEPAEVEPAAFRLVSVGDAARPIGTAPLVGRRDELAWLQAAFAGVQAERRSRVVTVLGDAGVGKSRLAAEFVGRLRGGARALVGRCVSYGEGATFLPLAEIVAQAVPERPRAAIAALLEGDDEAALIAERITQLTGKAGAAASAGELFWAVRRFLEALARERPLVVVLEDIHWAELTLLDLVDYIASWPTEAPLLVLCLARRELLDERPEWGSPHDRLALERLTDDDAAVLAAEVAGGAVGEHAQRQIVEIAEGNPLFLEQLVAFAEEAGAAAIASVPPTVEALLAGRLERLDAEERALLDRAAVVGRDFSRNALLALSPPDELAGLDSRLATAVRRGLVWPVRRGDDAYRFHHVLIRDVAYSGITKHSRAELHERHGAWLERRDGPDEIVGYHLEQAHRFRRELRANDPELPQLAKRGGDRLANAGIRAFKQADAAGAANLLARADALLPSGDPARPSLLCELGLAQRALGDSAAGEASVDRAIAAGTELRDPALALRARLERAHFELFTGAVSPSTVDELASEAIPVFEAAGDERALGRAWKALGYARGAMQCRCADWEVAAENAATHYRRSGWSTAGSFCEIAAALFYGPVPARLGIDRCERLLEQGDDRLGAANVLVFLAGLRALCSWFDESLEALAEAEGIYRELGETYALADTSGRILGRVHLLRGDPESAETVFRNCADVFARAHDEAALSTIGAELGQALYAQEQYTGAAEWCEVAEQHAPGGDVASQFPWRALRAKLLAREGHLREAAEFAAEAVRIAERTDALVHHGETLVDYASVLVLGGREAEAARKIKEAVTLFERKQSEASRRLARSQLAAVF